MTSSKASKPQTIDQLAQATGVHRRTLFAWKARGCPVDSRDPAKVLAWRAESASGHVSPEDSPRYEAQTRIIETKAAIEELKLAKERAGLVDRRVMVQAWERHLVDARHVFAEFESDLLAKLPQRITGRTRHAMSRAIRAYVGKALKTLERANEELDLEFGEVITQPPRRQRRPR